jgi:4-hydroxy-tetrahydrodipicolinate synthase
MIQSRLTPSGERIIEPMIALARCSKLQRIIVAGSKSPELMFELHRRGYVRVVTTANCGLPAEQYDVALVDWRQRSIKGNSDNAILLGPAQGGGFASRGRIPVIAETGSNSTSQAIELSRDAEAASADAVLSVVPYYNKPPQSGMYAHFRAVAESTGLPIILYDVPARTVCGLADDTIARLAELPQFIGLKDATGDVTRPLRLRSMVGSEFRLLSGDDATALAFFAQGGDGCISVTSNVAPGLCRAMHSTWAQGQIAQAQQLAAVAARLTAALSRESNPVPVKYALSLFNIISPRVRLPLVELGSETKG